MKQVLYAEDSLASQALMRRFLRDKCALTVVPSPGAAKDLLDQQPFSLLIADFLYPEGDAINLISGIRRTKGPLDLPIIVVSSSMDRLLLSRVLRAGANDAIAKPIDPPSFCTLVERMLTEPFVREQEHGVLGVCCFQWEHGNAFHQYCPELGITVTGTSRDDANAQMFETIRNRLAQGADMGATKNESMVNHVVAF
jgi:CheY-like chemotaxis protein